ncbi:hypothetical protein O181_109314 [Austropuccinia psidii MF-1]|uniref:Uncharacterized protein n=1 Tax=Austropuccinia psidii MF-1 TaxID=1389203 RepID=A0A9Q3PPT0_9BASI|nr:hypothetical protein [Austropuccinia psidii MF-1]
MSHHVQYKILLQSPSRQRQLSHVSHENVTQSPNPFQHYLQCWGNFTSLACASPPNPPDASHAYAPAPPSRRDSDTAPISVLTTPYAFTPRPYHLYAHVVHSRHAPDTTYPYACGVPSQHAPDTTYPYDCVVPSQHPPDTAYHPYARGVHSRHAPNTTYPYACVVPSRHAPDTTYPYACVVPSRHCLPSLRSQRALPTCSQHHLSLRLRSALPTPLILTLPYYIHSVRWLVGVHNERNRQNMLSGTRANLASIVGD